MLHGYAREFYPKILKTKIKANFFPPQFKKVGFFVLYSISKAHLLAYIYKPRHFIAQKVPFFSKHEKTDNFAAASPKNK